MQARIHEFSSKKTLQVPQKPGEFHTAFGDYFLSTGKLFQIVTILRAIDRFGAD
jgi:hypothetical protein